ncbi:cytochrome P450 [Fibrella arboris]|uniref:cytochrome P450 n=1 Tax=Fibrella arboris TaxID=3242486 RepID=UPI003520C58B
MNFQRIPSLTKRVLRASARRVFGLGPSFRPTRQSQLFVYGGRTKHWPGMGRELYEREPVFRASVQVCCQQFLALTGEDILPNFEGPLDLDFFAGGHRVVYSILTIQFALTDLWAAKGIIPDATLGLSLGEFAAVYAAGGLSLTDAIRACSAWKAASYLEDKDYLSLFVGSSLPQAQTLCRNAPVALWAVYETSATSTILLCRSADKDRATAYLDNQQISWQHPFTDTTRPFHTSLFRQHHPSVSHQLSRLTPMPLQRDFYSSTLGRVIPKHTVIDPMLWYELLSSPVLLYSTVTAAMANRHHVMTHVGPHPFLVGSSIKSAFSLPDHVRLLDSMRSGSAEQVQFEATYLQLKRLNRRHTYSLARLLPASSTKAASLIPTLHLLAPASVEHAPAIYAYLRRHHRICFLPQHKAWLVLHHEEVSYVLQKPDLFSNSPYREVDPFLLGADQPAHTTIRALLQPLFSARAMASLREFITDELNHRLDALIVRSSFDFVEELAIPLVQSVMGHFLGLRPIEAESLQASLTGHLYGMGYLQDLERFFQCYLKDVPTTGGQLGSLLMREVKAGNLSSATAVSLMRLLWAAGTSTTSMVLTSLVNALIRQPELAGQLRANASLVPKFVEEGVRLNPPESTLWRTVTQDTTLAGQPLPQGTRLMLSLLSANRDPQVFSSPDDYVLDRSASQAMAFGGGIHHCIGVGIARLEAQVLIQVILQRLPNLKLVEVPPQYYTSTSLRGLARLLVSP